MTDVTLYFATFVLDVRIAEEFGGTRLKDALDRSDRRLLAVQDPAAPDRTTLVALDRVQLAALHDDVGRGTMNPNAFDPRYRRAITLRCDDWALTGTAHPPITSRPEEWLNGDHCRFLAFTDATIAGLDGAARTFPVVFVRRNGLDAATWDPI